MDQCLSEFHKDYEMSETEADLVSPFDSTYDEGALARVYLAN